MVGSLNIQFTCAFFSSLILEGASTIELDWLRRLDIAIGVAQGLEYLHSFAVSLKLPAMHRHLYLHICVFMP